MGLAKRRLQKERSIHTGNLVKGVLFAIIGIWGGVMVLYSGIGENTGGKNSAGALARKGLSALLGDKADLVMPIIFAVVFFAVAIFGLRVIFRSLRGMSAKNTAIGRSVMTQAQPGETLKGLIADIDGDMEREHISYGPIHIGSRWILADEAMRVSRITGIYSIDAGVTGAALVLVDSDRNTQYIGLSAAKGEKIEDAAMSLHAICPGAVMGGNKEYVDMSEPGWDSEEPAIKVAPGALKTVGGLTLTRNGGAPTSNFDREYLEQTLKQLEIGEELRINMLEPTKPSKYMEAEGLLGRRKGDREWELAVAYTEYSDEPGEARCPTDYYGVLDAMTVLTQRKQLPDFATWEEHNFVEEAKKRAKQEKKAQKKK